MVPKELANKQSESDSRCEPQDQEQFACHYVGLDELA